MNVYEVLYACKESEKELVSINSNGQQDLDLIQGHDRLLPAAGMAARTRTPDTMTLERGGPGPIFLTIRSHLRRKFASIPKNRPAVMRFMLLVCAATALCSVNWRSGAPTCVWVEMFVCSFLMSATLLLYCVREGRDTRTHNPPEEERTQRSRECVRVRVLDYIRVAMVVGLMQVPWSWAVISLGRDH